MEVAALAAAHQQQAEADELADDGGKSRARDAHVHDKNQQGVQGDVQHSAAGDAHHAVGSAALEPELVVQHQGGGHPRRADEDDAHIGLRVGQDGVRGAQQIGQRFQKELAQNTEEQTHTQSGEKPGGCHVGGVIEVLFSQFPGDEVAAAVTEEKADGLDNSHQGKDHAHSAGSGIAVQFSHEKCIRHIVKGSDQHTDDAGKSQLADQSAYGFLCHFVEFLLLPFVHISDLKRFRFIKIVYHTFKKRKVTLLQHRR